MLKIILTGYKDDLIDAWQQYCGDQNRCKAKVAVSWLLMIREHLINGDVDNALTYVEDKIWESLHDTSKPNDCVGDKNNYGDELDSTG